MSISQNGNLSATQAASQSPSIYLLTESQITAATAIETQRCIAKLATCDDPHSRAIWRRQLEAVERLYRNRPGRMQGDFL